MVDLLSLVIYGKCQLASTVLDSEHEAHWKMSCPQATLIKSDCLNTIRLNTFISVARFW